jgi:exonuclease SbcC
MKIMQITGKNLNSLYGEWTVDFTHPAYESTGIFAITGPTGAGKSTILDALCLALYGKTPRLDKVSAGQNDIMSRHSGECSARVIFETREGRYCVHWYQKRARKKSEGRLQPPKWELSQLPDKTLLEDSLRHMPARMEEITGMDFHRFTRSMLLAQGRFDSFLQADEGERSEMLEQITGTGIYSEISKKVHEYNRREQEKLAHLRESTGELKLRSREEVQEVTDAMVEAQKKHGELQKAHRGDIALRERCLHVENLRREKGELEKEHENHRGEEAVFAPQRQRLEAARRAGDLAGRFERLSGVRKQLEREKKNCAQYEEELPGRIEAHTRAEKKQRDAQNRFEALQREEKTERELFTAVREKDRDIAEVEKEIRRLLGECRDIASQEEIQQKKQAETRGEYDRLKKRAAEISEYFTRHEVDKELLETYDTLGADLSRLATLRDDCAREEAEVSKKQDTLETFRRQYRQVQTDFARVEKDMQALEKTEEETTKEYEGILKGVRLREYRSKKEHLLEKRSYEEKIRSLQEERKNLREGHSCPLCGSKEHPFVTHYHSDLSRIEQELSELSRRIKKAEQKEADLVIVRRQKEEHGKKYADHDKKLAEVTERGKNLSRDLEEQQRRVDDLQKNCDDLGRALSQKIAPYGMVFTEYTIKDISQGLKKRRDTWQKMETDARDVQKELEKRDDSLRSIAEVCKSLQEKHTGLADDLSKQQGICRQIQEKRRELFGSKDVKEEERILEQRLQDADTMREKARTQAEEALREKKSCEDSIDKAKKRIAELERDRIKLEESFAEARRAAGFEYEESFCAARMEREERDRLAQREKDLEEKMLRLTERLKKVRGELSELEKSRVIEPVEKIERRLKEQQANLEKIQKEISECEYILREEEEKKKKRAEAQGEIDRQEEVCAQWGALHSLIGSADGKKFRTFAQSLTFRTMAAHANRELKKMSDRYILTMGSGEALNLSVIDQYQGGEVRSTKNLSGGESFLVSLSLALGLSKMAGNSVRVDSLFLDEGFGTLDEDSLETAVNALSHLHEEGKIIGVISHVAALKDGIEPRIEIVPGVGGKSRISGPGCSMKGESNFG